MNPNTNPWVEVRRFDDGDLTLVVMKQTPMNRNHLPRFSFHVGRANGDHVSPHIPVFARLSNDALSVNYPNKRIEELMGEAREFIDKELQSALHSTNGHSARV